MILYSFKKVQLKMSSFQIRRLQGHCAGDGGRRGEDQVPGGDSEMK